MTKFLTKWYLGNSVCSLVPIKHEDERGFMSEVYEKNTLKELGIIENFIQENQSFTKEKFTFRGLHFQKPPYDQAKLIRVLQGSILDIFVDLRANSPTYLKHEAITLSAKNFKQVYIPSGFAHGFLTLEKNCEIIYKISNYYDHPSDASISVFDPALEISLPCKKDEVVMSEKDRNAKNWESIGEIF